MLWSGQFKSLRPGRFYGTSTTAGSQASYQQGSYYATEGFFQIAGDNQFFFPLESPRAPGANEIVLGAVTTAANF